MSKIWKYVRIGPWVLVVQTFYVVREWLRKRHR